MEKLYEISGSKGHWNLRYTIDNGTWRHESFSCKTDLNRMVRTLTEQGYKENN